MAAKFLWLEDQPATKPTVVEGLKYEFDCEIEFVTSTGEMIAKLSDDQYDILFLDLRLPQDSADGVSEEIDPDYGFKALGSFREVWNENFSTSQDIPVLILSARFDPEARRESSNYAQVKEYIAKPLRYNALINAVRLVLGDSEE